MANENERPGILAQMPEGPLALRYLEGGTLLNVPEPVLRSVPIDAMIQIIPSNTNTAITALMAMVLSERALAIIVPSRQVSQHGKFSRIARTIVRFYGANATRKI